MKNDNLIYNDLEFHDLIQYIHDHDLLYLNEYNVHQVMFDETNDKLKVFVTFLCDLNNEQYDLYPNY